MKLIGVDYGRRRIGVAVTDVEGTIARGLCVIDRKKCGTGVNPHPDQTIAGAAISRPPRPREKNISGIDELLNIINNEKPSAIVFGLPLGPDDEETAMSREVREFASIIANRTNLPIHFTDESFTSKKAAELMMHRRKKARRDKSLPDRIAACLILQDYVDSAANEKNQQ